MPNRFKLKLPRVISSSLQICRSRNRSGFPENPLPNKPGRRRLSLANPKAVEVQGLPKPPPSTPEEDSFVSVKVIQSIGHPRRDYKEDSGLDADSIEFSWREDGKWHVVNKRVDLEVDDDELEPVTVGRHEKSHGGGAVIRKRDASSASMRVFSGEYGSNESKSLLSSSARFWKEEDEEERGRVALVSMLRRAMSMESGGGEVRDSVAVVKRSENPLEDFRTSMIEMVVERRMFEASDLERLLRCFLSLNSREYHRVIVEAFTELWQMMFCDDYCCAEFTK